MKISIFTSKNKWTNSKCSKQISQKQFEEVTSQINEHQLLSSARRVFQTLLPFQKNTKRVAISKKLWKPQLSIVKQQQDGGDAAPPLVCRPPADPLRLRYVECLTWPGGACQSSLQSSRLSGSSGGCAALFPPTWQTVTARYRGGKTTLRLRAPEETEDTCRAASCQFDLCIFTFTKEVLLSTRVFGVLRKLQNRFPQILVEGCWCKYKQRREPGILLPLLITDVFRFYWTFSSFSQEVMTGSWWKIKHTLCYIYIF